MPDPVYFAVLGDDGKRVTDFYHIKGFKAGGFVKTIKPCALPRAVKVSFYDGRQRVLWTHTTLMAAKVERFGAGTLLKIHSLPDWVLEPLQTEAETEAVS